MPKAPFTALVILDGWGLGPRTDWNAVALARTPTMDRISTVFPTTTLRTSGRAVGLPEGLMGNSEVGHLNLGAGRVVTQAMTLIEDRIHDGTFLTNPALLSAVSHVRSSGRTLHLMGLVSDGGVHSWPTHYGALVQIASQSGLPADRLALHAFLDGRDTPPTSGVKRIREVVELLTRWKVGRLASICGRYYAMDRDRRWDRTRLAYDLLTLGQGVRETDPVAAVEHAYARGETDEFVKPVVLVGGDGAPVATICDGDAVIFFNFRGDRPRQLTRAFTLDGFDGFDRSVRPKVRYVTLTRYEQDVPVDAVAYPPEALSQDMPDIFGETVSRAGKRQVRIAETEKYAHVTFFFNGQREQPFDGEDRILVPSPKDVPTYDHKPEMSAPEVADRFIDAIRSRTYDAAICNFANPDMVGHTGVVEAAVRAVATVDACLGRVLTAIESVGGVAIVTADHGNCEQMRHEETGEPHTAHTTNPVPLVLVDPSYRGTLRTGGALCDVAPTILGLMGLPQPQAMTGRDLRAR
jgi:2,3-bisphosphoglycerate-independent phosphoglycerate mutase